MVETGGGTSLVIVFPFLIFVAGVVYLLIAANDEKKRRPTTVRRFAERANHPLRHVQIAMKATTKPAREPSKDQTKGEGKEKARKRPPGPRRLRGI